MKKNKIKSWKPGQLVTIDNIVYRVVRYDYRHIQCTKVCDFNSICHSGNIADCVRRLGLDRCLKRI